MCGLSAKWGSVRERLTFFCAFLNSIVDIWQKWGCDILGETENMCCLLFFFACSKSVDISCRAATAYDARIASLCSDASARRRADAAERPCACACSRDCASSATSPARSATPPSRADCSLRRRDDPKEKKDQGAFQICSIYSLSVACGETVYGE